MAVFLDRDGVLNEVRGSGRHSLPPRSLNELRIVPEATGAMERLHDAGFTLIMVSNQPDVARGSMSADTVLEITGAVVAELGLDDTRISASTTVRTAPRVGNRARVPCTKLPVTGVSISRAAG